MESILNLLANSDNWRLLVTLAFISCGFVIMKSQMKDMGYSLSKRIDGVESSLSKQIDELRGQMTELRVELKGEIKELKYNDFAHLSSAFEALTYVLEKTSLLSKEDKEFVDKRLAH